jgi:hypothetical protein
LGLPPVQFFAQRFAAGIGLQTCGPIRRHWFSPAVDRLFGVELAIHGLQVFQQHAPRHAVDHQVMDRNEQALLTFGPSTSKRSSGPFAGRGCAGHR